MTNKTKLFTVLSAISLAVAAGAVVIGNKVDTSNVYAEAKARVLVFDKDNQTVESEDGNTFHAYHDYGGTQNDNGVAILSQNGFRIQGTNYKFNHIETVEVTFNAFVATGGSFSATLSKTVGYIAATGDIQLQINNDFHKENEEGLTYKFDFSSLAQDGDYDIQFWGTFHDSESNYYTPIKSIKVTYTC